MTFLRKVESKKTVNIEPKPINSVSYRQSRDSNVCFEEEENKVDVRKDIKEDGNMREETEEGMARED